jgi:lysophospholipase L1-like esterase
MRNDSNNRMIAKTFILVLTGLMGLNSSNHAASPSEFKFDFGVGSSEAGYRKVLPATFFSKETGYGFDCGSQVEVVPQGRCITAKKPFFFSIALPEGNYRVTVTFGDATSGTTNTVKAESRRLMLEQVITAAGKFTTRTFAVNIRTPQIPGKSPVRLKTREQDVLHWDNKLTLEFNGTRPCVSALIITRMEDAITVFLAGDSTVTDQPLEPWNSWGQMFTRFFKPDLTIANYAESGESIKSSLGAKRFDKIFSQLNKGDYLLIQFGHNDQKDKATNALETYRINLKKLVTKTRQQGGTPVLITSMERKSGITRNTLASYPETVRQVAREENVTLIDLQPMSQKLYAALGTNLDKAFQDGTHHNTYGSYEIARCVVEAIRQSKLELAKHLAEDVTPFDPSHPDPVEQFSIPPSPGASALKPDGN